ncbi:helix-turn-helix domain-containing protein [Flavobacterium sediminilitoris]|uniref:Helix-turn-helix domain-containing protein n=1 Tax=Flavobacterium sediminilitoris TaxID=2024526 RepID=A0ABY4HQQ1_9FLAO|nr:MULTISPECIES: helix-turn-helix transcriptional regulator [Flavobacterium]UOX34522.1 helix-turn-helix domain-containing protein [Flavobacterium sediminilitoris]
MDKKGTIREELGVSQSDLAIVLKVSKTQLAMYETGRRDLPSDVLLKLADMVIFVRKVKNSSIETAAYLKEENKKMKRYLEGEILINKHRQLILEKKISRVEKKYEDNIAKLKFVAYLKKMNDKDSLIDAHLKLMEVEAIKEMGQNGYQLQEKYKLKKRTLEDYEKYLKEALQRVL